MDISTYTMKRLDCCSKYDNQWVARTPLGTKVMAQILLGADASTLFPYDVVNENSLPVQTAHARLKRSWITGKYLTVGHNGPTTRAYVIPTYKDLDEELNNFPTDEENEEDLQDYDRPTEDYLPSDTDEVPKTIHYKPDRELFGDPFDEKFYTWIINTNSNSYIE